LSADFQHSTPCLKWLRSMPWKHWFVPRFGYLAMLLFTATGSWWLEWAFRIRVLRRIRFTLFTIIPVSLFFLMWDWFAIDSEHWDFDYSQMLGITGPFNIPLEEYLFFLVVPLAIILTYEGVSKLKPHWRDRVEE
ncbi:MAG: lycopene cyclase domain-containing protein, partial [Candidatus Nanopelagicaceae bacterium]